MIMTDTAGLGLARTTSHPGSKRWFSHRPSAAGDVALSKAHTWSQVTGRPLPPAARIRTDKVSNAVPLGHRDRQDRYSRRNRTEVLTPRQARRKRAKVGRQLARLKTGSLAWDETRQLYVALRESVR
jgi:hypothetical protein